VQFRNPNSNECLAVDANDIGNEGLIWQWGCGANGWLEWQVNGSGDLNTNGDADLELENLNAAECMAVDADDIGNGAPSGSLDAAPTDGWNGAELSR
jgi:hypothetical protein